jgi:hypothetical protein
MSAGPLKGLMLFAWMVASLLIFPLLLAPFVAPAHFLLSMLPNCPGEAAGGGILCTLAQGLILISRGKLNDAVRAAPVAIPVYAALIWNQCVAFWFVWTELSGIDSQPREAAREVAYKP